MLKCCSPDGAERHPGPPIPDFATLNAGCELPATGLLAPPSGHPHIHSSDHGRAANGMAVARFPGRRKGPIKVAHQGFETMSRVPSLSSPFLLGFDEIERVLDRVTKASDGYPPYNIERVAANEGNPERLRITLAVAGFTRDQLDVTI